MKFLLCVCVCLWLWRVEFADFTGCSDLRHLSLVSLEGSTAAHTHTHAHTPLHLRKSPNASRSSEEPSVRAAPRPNLR